MVRFREVSLFQQLMFFDCLLSVKRAKFTSLSLIPSQIPTCISRSLWAISTQVIFSQLNLNSVSPPDYRYKIASIIFCVHTVLETITTPITQYYPCPPVPFLPELALPHFTAMSFEGWGRLTLLPASLIGPHWYKSIGVILSPLQLNLDQIWHLQMGMPWPLGLIYVGPVRTKSSTFVHWIREVRLSLPLM